jgi:two-component system response regulator GlrR
MRMGGMDGLALFEAINRRHPSLPVILSPRTATSRCGHRDAQGRLQLPHQAVEARALMAEVERALALARHWRTGDGGARHRDAQSDDAAAARGSAPRRAGRRAGAPRRARAAAARSCSRARSMAQPAARGPFIALNCGALPRTCSKASSSAREGLFTGARDHKGSSRAPTAAPSSSTRSATCRSACR